MTVMSVLVVQFRDDGSSECLGQLTTFFIVISINLITKFIGWGGNDHLLAVNDFEFDHQIPVEVTHGTDDLIGVSCSW